ncbi:MAG: hypothetical protein K2M31_07895 [Muribaculaceae bacterium]|nr:hypothetical protein [Muribaculaceae bacterium]
MAKRFFISAARFAEKCKSEYLTNDVIEIVIEASKVYAVMAIFGLIIAMAVWLGIECGRPF